MKTYKEEQGILSVEASIVLVLLLFFTLFIYNFGYIFRAQNYMAHGTLETAKSLSYKSYQYKVEESEYVLEVAKSVISFFGYESDEGIIKQQWKASNYESAVATFFKSCYTTDDILEEYHIKNVTFAGTTVKDGKLTVLCTYQVDLPFKVFGLDYIELHQEAKMGLWS